MLISLKAHLIEYLRGYHRIRLFIYLILLLLMAIPQGWTVSAQEGDLSSGTREADSMNNIEEGMDDDSLIMDTLMSPDAAEAFVIKNIEDTIAHLKLLQEMNEKCCQDDDINFPNEGGNTCSRGDFFIYLPDRAGGVNRGWIDMSRPCSPGNAKKLFESASSESGTSEKNGKIIHSYNFHVSLNDMGAKIGAVKVTLNGMPCNLTVNRVKIDQFGYPVTRVGQRIDKEEGTVLRSVGPAAGGDPVTVRVKIVGPANMSGYKTSWQIENGKIRKAGGFKKEDGERFWEARAEIDLLTDSPAIASLKISKGKFEREFKGIRVWGRLAPLDHLVLFRQGHGGFELEPADNIDIFIPSDDVIKGAILESQSLLKNGQRVPNWGALGRGLEDVSIDMEDSTVATYHPSSSLEEGNFQLIGNQPGATKLWVRYKENNATGRSQPMAEYYFVNVHRLWLTKIINTDNTSRLKLLGKGPRLSRYKVHFKGGEGVSGKFQFKEGLWQFEGPAEGVMRIELKDNKTGFRAAVLNVGRRVPIEAATIQLLQPDTPQITKLVALPLPDTSVNFGEWALSSGFCNKVANNQLPSQSKGLGVKEMGDLLSQAKQACANRAQAKTDIKEIRRIVSEFNGLLDGMSKGGMELVGLEDDTVNLAAAIRGLSWHHAQQAMCKWTLEDGGESQMRFVYTPVKMISPTSAASLNEVTNLIKGYEPGMRVKVQLIIELN